jgi:TonB family protein
METDKQKIKLRNGGRLLRAGVISLFLHVILMISLSLGMNPLPTKVGSVVYRVTLKTISPQSDSSPNISHPPIPEKVQIQKKEKRSKQPTHSMEKGEAPIPLPMGDLSTSDKDLNIKMENLLPVHFSLSHLGEQNQNIIPDTASGEGSGQGGPGSGGFGDGLGTGRGGPGWEGFEGGPEQGGSGREGSGDGSGSGRGSSGWGGSGNGRSGALRPGYAENPKPIYPIEAREKGYQGEVLLKVEVLSNGGVGQVEMKKSSGYEILDQSAFLAVKKWKFIPARKDGTAIPVWVNIPIKFELF